MFSRSWLRSHQVRCTYAHNRKHRSGVFKGYPHRQHRHNKHDAQRCAVHIPRRRRSTDQSAQRRKNRRLRILHAHRNYKIRRNSQIPPRKMQRHKIRQPDSSQLLGEEPERTRIHSPPARIRNVLQPRRTADSAYIFHTDNRHCNWRSRVVAAVLRALLAQPGNSH